MGGYRRNDSMGELDYSLVDEKLTIMDNDDVDILHNGNNGYFQTANSFVINKAIRRSQKERIPLESALIQEYENYGYHTDEAKKKTEKAFKVIEAMDRSMKPLDKDMQVARFTTNKWLRTVLKKMGVYTNDMSLVPTPNLHYEVRKRIDKINDMLSNNSVTYYDQSFNSATYNLSFSDAAFLGRPVRIEYIGTKGTKAVFSPFEESEVVFDRKSGIEIERIGWDDDRYQLVIYGRTVKK